MKYQFRFIRSFFVASLLTFLSLYFFELSNITGSIIFITLFLFLGNDWNYFAQKEKSKRLEKARKMEES